LPRDLPWASDAQTRLNGDFLVFKVSIREVGLLPAGWQ
jgi:hypothetical protein